LETFALKGINIDHGEAVSFLISAKQALGMTEGYSEFSDQHTVLSIHMEPQQAALVGMLSHLAADRKKFTRLSLSHRELDDTSKFSVLKNQKFEFQFKIFKFS
jgi:hypothetical protein